MFNIYNKSKILMFFEILENNTTYNFSLCITFRYKKHLLK